MPEAVLTRAALNRALLARQMLLERAAVDVSDAIERLAGLQAQVPKPPFIGLWTRLQDFRRESLLTLLAKRKVVRATAMRATIHLLTRRDYLRFRPALRGALDGGLKVLGDRASGIRREDVLRAGTEFFGAKPRTFDALRKHIGDSTPDERAFAYAVRLAVPLVQVPDSAAAWGFTSSPDFALAESWLGEPVATEGSSEAIVMSYFAAFGPASVKDLQVWSALPAMKAVVEKLRPKLKVFRDDRGRELFDLPRAPRPAADTPAPVRFLPEFDNIILGHDDRSRIIDDAFRPLVCTRNLRILSTFLADGFVAGTWKTEVKRGTATLVIEPFVKLSKKTRSELESEGTRLLRFTDGDAKSHAVVVRPTA